ncbi:hypothetical protein DERP_003852 [Dermatophagoides pteronyssinus]|uniref:Uncharacterized protein n=1 Tax=Dermatophagoides pteronyssinus TaxID=6956 RepID=A0ABQ8J836_DERPT|nr:hypothetical protein DERP_003852 [Dermatophagoides pteronyssinus]
MQVTKNDHFLDGIYSSFFVMVIISISSKSIKHIIRHGKSLWIIGEENTWSQIKLLVIIQVIVFDFGLRSLINQSINSINPMNK